ncbi:protein phosphatase 2C domain-containing protein [Gleimia sp. 6138-11-ORH1]|uniref:PP2C family protein-serine/threonine phosphatase n=1 Tax=Gleimia sp. 6138-11-ORH1 TaxID=2973937 RepID=UPI0021695622|nr:PP2C family serine/threonine-protein phosphatase [Gleimia sp. 6138-11-ORH1]MCS4485108.1 protein phosphatase 2C domain-containing protein [Gleimia sp. 6138-11-ORH1]
MTVEFRYAARSDVGLIRKSNQDSGYAGPHLLILADGVGGSAGGDLASSIVVGHLAHLDTDSYPAEDMLGLLRKGLADTRTELLERAKVDPKLKGMGTTCIALMRSGNKLAMVHVGDSRAYLLRDGRLTQVTSDHSFVQYLVDTGQITEKEAETHAQRNVVLKVLSSTEIDGTPDESLREAIVGDRWLLCSDGLSGVVSDDTICAVMQEYADPDECADILLELALRAGGPDNITVVLAEVVPAGTLVEQTPQIVGAVAVDRARPTRGSKGAAGKAASISAADNLDLFEDDAPSLPVPRRTWLTPFLALVITAVLGLGIWAGYAWSQQQYYALIKDDKILIYQGIPQTIGPIELSHPVGISKVDPKLLRPVELERLKEPVRRNSREAIDSYLETLEKQQGAGQSKPESSGGN